MSDGGREVRPRKHLDYTRQRINNYGECPRSSRKNIRRRKICEKRRIRRALDRDLREHRGDPDGPNENLRFRPFFRKSPDTPLGVVVVQKILRRHANGNMSTATCLARIARIESFVQLPSWLEWEVRELEA